MRDSSSFRPPPPLSPSLPPASPSLSLPLPLSASSSCSLSLSTDDEGNDDDQVSLLRPSHPSTPPLSSLSSSFSAFFSLSSHSFTFLSFSFCSSIVFIIILLSITLMLFVRYVSFMQTVIHLNPIYSPSSPFPSASSFRTPLSLPSSSPFNSTALVPVILLIAETDIYSPELCPLINSALREGYVVHLIEYVAASSHVAPSQASWAQIIDARRKKVLAVQRHIRALFPASASYGFSSDSSSSLSPSSSSSSPSPLFVYTDSRDVFVQLNASALYHRYVEYDKRMRREDNSSSFPFIPPLPSQSIIVFGGEGNMYPPHLRKYYVRDESPVTFAPFLNSGMYVAPSAASLASLYSLYSHLLEQLQHNPICDQYGDQCIFHLIYVVQMNHSLVDTEEFASLFSQASSSPTPSPSLPFSPAPPFPFYLSVDRSHSLHATLVSCSVDKENNEFGPQYGAKEVVDYYYIDQQRELLVNKRRQAEKNTDTQKEGDENIDAPIFIHYPGESRYVYNLTAVSFPVYLEMSRQKDERVQSGKRFEEYTAEYMDNLHVFPADKGNVKEERESALFIAGQCLRAMKRDEGYKRHLSIIVKQRLFPSLT